MMHDHVRSRLSAYLEGELVGAARRRRSRPTSASAPPCSAELRALRRAVDLLHALATPELPSDIGGAVLERLRAGEGAPRALARVGVGPLRAVRARRRHRRGRAARRPARRRRLRAVLRRVAACPQSSRASPHSRPPARPATPGS